jgi:hypothetical protein
MQENEGITTAYYVGPGGGLARFLLANQVTHYFVKSLQIENFHKTEGPMAGPKLVALGINRHPLCFMPNEWMDCAHY